MSVPLAMKLPSKTEPSAAARALEQLAVRKAQEGDATAFSRLYRAFGPMVHALVLVRVSAAEVDDVMQEVFATAWRRLPELRDPASFGGWLAQIARRSAVDRLRRRRAVVQMVEEPPMHGPSPLARAEAQGVLAVIATLPEAYSETLVMRLVEGMTGPEISLRTGQTPGSVRVNLCRGMKLLRAKLRGGSHDV